MLLLDDTINAVAASETAAEVVEKGAASQSYWDLAIQGGWIMIVLAVLSVLAIYIFIDKYLAVKKAGKNQDGFMQNIKNYIKEGKIDNAIDSCRNNDSPISRMIEKGLQRIGRPLNDVNTAIENVGKQEVAKLEKGLALLATIAGGAPMIGFFGTVTGMVQYIHKFCCLGFEVVYQVVDLCNQDVVCEVGDDTNEQTADCCYKCSFDTSSKVFNFESVSSGSHR